MYVRAVLRRLAINRLKTKTRLSRAEYCIKLEFFPSAVGPDALAALESTLEMNADSDAASVFFPGKRLPKNYKAELFFTIVSRLSTLLSMLCGDTS